MRSLIVLVIISVIMQMPVYAQEHMQAIAACLGTDAIEDADPYEVENMEDLIRHPVAVNLVSISRLKETGLFTPYQIASLSDYRSRHGDVMSFSELEALDGFGHEAISRLAPFISLETFRSPSQKTKDGLYVHNEISFKSGASTGKLPTYGLKYRMDAGEPMSASFSVSRTSDASSFSPDAFSGNLTVRFRKIQGALTVGDFNARFGQGLALWNGMGIGGIPAPSSLMKRPAGISASSSFTGKYAMRGLAGHILLHKIKISPFLAFDLSEKEISVLPGINLNLLLRDANFSFTHYSDMTFATTKSSVNDMKTSLDMSLCVDGTDIFAETAYDWVSRSSASLAGVVFPVGEYLRTGVVGRFYPADYSASRSSAIRSLTKCSNEYSVSMSSEFSAGEWIDLKGREGFGSSVRRSSGMFSLDFAYFPVPKDAESDKSIQLKVKADWSFMMSSAWKIKIRISERVRTWDMPFRSEIRTEITYDTGMMTLISRTDVVRCADLAMLTYAEAGYKKGNSAIYLRLGTFKADDWDDRIYVYERDAPGSFNVPAYYGRGFWASAMFRLRFARWGRAYLRASACTYAIMKQPKPGKAELRLQIELDI